MKKVCVVTAARSEYGLLRWLIEEIKEEPLLQLQLIVTGGHMSHEQGYTYKEIENDGYSIDAKIEMLMSTNTRSGIVKSMGICSLSISDAFDNLKPDLLVVLGDRYELLPIVSAALIYRIPVAHISGGDITLGAIDDQIRNAITMMATLHFPGTDDSAKRIERMIGTNQNVYSVGEPGLDNFKRLSLWSRDKLAKNLNLDISKKWILLTFHPETKLSIKLNIDLLHNTLDSILDFGDIELVVTKANADFGGSQINATLEEYNEKGRFSLHTSLGQVRYLSFMKEAACIIGNSSSGIVEAPYLGKPVINIGNRQKGRHLCTNVISVAGENETIKQVLGKILEDNIQYEADDYYGDGMASIKMKNYIKKYLTNNN